MCKMRSNCKLLKRFEIILTYVSIENLNSQLMKIIDFNEYERKID